MKLKEGFITHDSGDEQVMVSVGSVQFSGLVRSNKTAAYIIDCLKTETTMESIVSKMMDKYDASEDVIARDVDLVINKLRGIGAIDE